MEETYVYTFFQSYYLFALKDAISKPIDPDFPNGVILGYTSQQGKAGEVMTFIFAQAIKDKYPNDDGVIQITVVHELGHMRAALSHLYYFNEKDSLWYQNGDHDDKNCVMSQGGKISPCTLSNISTDFCPNDRKKLALIDW